MTNHSNDELRRLCEAAPKPYDWSWRREAMAFYHAIVNELPRLLDGNDALVAERDTLRARVTELEAEGVDVRRTALEEAREEMRRLCREWSEETANDRTSVCFLQSFVIDAGESICALIETPR